MKAFLKRFWPYFLDYKLFFFLAILGALGAAAGTAGAAEVMKRIVDGVLLAKDTSSLWMVAVFIIGLYLIKGVGRYVQAYFTNYIGQDIVRRLRDRLLGHMLDLDMAFFNSARSGELISRISSDIQRLQNVVASIIPELTRDSLVIVGLMIYAIWLNPMLAFIALVILPSALYPLSLLAKRMKRISHSSQEKNADVTTRLTEIFNNVEMIKANATESKEVTRFGEQNRHFFKINMKGVMTSEFVSPMMEVFGAFGVAAVLVYGGHAVINGDMTAGELIAFVTAVGLLYDPMKKIAGLYNRMQDGVAAAERVFILLDQKATILEGSKQCNNRIDTITFKGVGLDYDGVAALQDISFSARKGETIALVGDSGGGKSSLVNLILRFYDANSGSILINDDEIKRLDLASLRRHIAIVSQRVYIFADTLAENVAYGLPYDEQKVIEALEKADASEFVSQLENGIHTVMDEFGANLSGGQRQRIAIARAIYKDADVLILDEATSALDNKSEKRIQEALEQISRSKITFTIAHRLSTIEHADKIMVFKSGRIVGQGRHEELLHSSPEYQRLRGNAQM